MQVQRGGNRHQAERRQGRASPVAPHPATPSGSVPYTMNKNNTTQTWNGTVAKKGGGSRGGVIGRHTASAKHTHTQASPTQMQQEQQPRQPQQQRPVAAWIMRPRQPTAQSKSSQVQPHRQQQQQQQQQQWQGGGCGPAETDRVTTHTTHSRGLRLHPPGPLRHDQRTAASRWTGAGRGHQRQRRGPRMRVHGLQPQTRSVHEPPARAQGATNTHPTAAHTQERVGKQVWLEHVHTRPEGPQQPRSVAPTCTEANLRQHFFFECGKNEC